ncbi:hypothetical protein [Psychrobacter ciconiae]|uniref:hypothetical protein n=1 Tax=Psychrobacter ciconiae TaxID=1553449 RepID=UPI00191847F5|nr:hypothetical protein [Psychrobacter ciconiae]
MATLYQIYSPMDTLRRHVIDIKATWQVGDSILLLGDTAVFIDWLGEYLSDVDIRGVSAIYALKEDIDALPEAIKSQIDLARFTDLLTDSDWTELCTANTDIDKVVTVCL